MLLDLGAFPSIILINPGNVARVIMLEMTMSDKRKVEVFSAGCPVCEDVVRLVKASTCSSCDVTVLDTNDVQIAKRKKSLGILKIPAVVINGLLASCCASGAVDLSTLKAAGLGSAKA